MRRRFQVLIATWAVFLPIALRAALPLVHEPCAIPAGPDPCPACLAIAQPNAALVPAPTVLPGATFAGAPAVDEPPTPPALPNRQSPSPRGPPAS